MEQTTLATPEMCLKVFARDLEDGQQVETAFLVKEASRRQKRNGEAFLKLQLGDVTGTVDAVCWDGVEAVEEQARAGAVVVVRGAYSVDERYGATLTIRAARAAGEGEYLAADLYDAPPIPVEQMEADLRELIGTIQHPALRELLDRLFDQESELWRRWREWPAAKTYHQAYRHGLLEHCLSVAQGVSAMAATFPGLDRDVAVTGAILHDIGKTQAYSMEDGAIDLSDAGKLQGEIPLGYYIVRSQIERIPAFPEATAEALLHIILSHHGSLQHGSPVVPCTREATLVHMIDNLGGRLGSFDRLEKSLGDGQRWSRFDRALDGSAFFGAAVEQQQAGSQRAA
jgi:3'-5' exoribonuclease